MEMKDFASCHAEDCLPDVGGHQDPLEAIYAAAKRREDAKEAALNAEAKAISELIGHNGGPAIKEPFGLKARWLSFVNAIELRRLALIEYRLHLAERRAKELREERAKIRSTAIKRMRRATGKAN
jgi:hypothetical protein